MMSYYNTIFNADSRKMANIPNNSIDMMITSPPYNVTKQYDEDLSLTDYLDLLHDVMKEVYRVLKETGIVMLNVANIGRKPYIPLDSYIMEILHDIGFHIFEEIIWNKEASAGSSCAWGSWQSASNPSLRDVHEYIILAIKNVDFYDNTFDVTDLSEIPEKIDGREHNISLDDIISNIWSFPTESAKRVNHPAPFRVELPLRGIFLFSKPGDIILDPFIGSGSTALACLYLGRNYVGYELNEQYIQIAENRIKNIEKFSK